MALEVPSAVEVPGFVQRYLPKRGGKRKGRVVLDGESTLLPCTDPPGKCPFHGGTGLRSVFWRCAWSAELFSALLLHLNAAPSEHCSEHSSLHGSPMKGWGTPACSCLWHFRGFQSLSPWSRGLIPQRQQACPGSALTPDPELSMWDPQALSTGWLKP